MPRSRLMLLQNEKQIPRTALKRESGLWKTMKTALEKSKKKIEHTRLETWAMPGVPDVVFFLSLLLGGMLLGIGCLLFPQLQLSTILIIILTVAFVAVSIAAPRYFAYIFFGGFAVYHGIVHMLEMSVPVTASGYIIGLLLSTWLLLMLGLILRQVIVTRKPHSERAP